MALFPARYRPRIGVGALLLIGIGFLLAALVAILTIGGAILLDRQQAHDQRVNAVLAEGVRAELRAGYAELERFLEAREPRYRRAHEKARQTIEERGIEETDLEALAKRLSEELGDPVHVYIVTPELRISRTTFEPDEGLDFTMEGMEDAHGMLKTALAEDQVLIGPPTLELVSREFRFYTYGPLGDDGYALELGLSPAFIDEVFRGMEERLDQRALYEGELFFLVNGQWLISLGLDPALQELNKAKAFAEVPTQQDQKLERFQRAVGQRGLYRPETTDQPRSYYAWLNRIELDDDGHHLDILARLEMQHPGSEDVRKIWIAVLVGTGGLVVLATALFHQMARRLLVTPLRQTAQAAAARQTVPIHGPVRWIHELRLLAWQINRGLARSRREIHALDQQAQHDRLTGLLNRSGLDQQIATQVAQHQETGKPLAMLLIDLDHFKRVNDEHGHAVGDKILRHLADQLRAGVREADIVGRWGGEEFVILLPATGLDGAQQSADKLRRALADHPVLRQHGLTASFGVSVLASEDSDRDLFERADCALYAAKHQGRNRVSIVSPS
ncbi:GGDEF domain-containing protein [Halorhodospira halophila]|uniref:diguanylate cyclase n=1 Tax=Halorhodospira halophila (strain DSM 244 / SL1) TaxID=349124 RepID=A1WWL1_HALHL|nr:GGDEF domain-containing protein [Halorhodospira halophila]ABM62073.1 diguanylate cyclase [Halorhodospira halophila SL1]MBK1729400.1 GGDEF domain-containing protein [Halorhodospira halophila]